GQGTGKLPATGAMPGQRRALLPSRARRANRSCDRCVVSRLITRPYTITSPRRKPISTIFYLFSACWGRCIFLEFRDGDGRNLGVEVGGEEFLSEEKPTGLEYDGRSVSAGGRASWD